MLGKFPTSQVDPQIPKILRKSQEMKGLITLFSQSVK